MIGNGRTKKAYFEKLLELINTEATIKSVNLECLETKNKIP